jgi:hypothetical protein
MLMGRKSQRWPPVLKRQPLPVDSMVPRVFTSFSLKTASDSLTLLSRCELHITGSYSIDIDIQVELEVTHVAYSVLREHDKRALMIFSVMINRPCAWAANNSEYLSHFPNVTNYVPNQRKPGMEKLGLSLTLTVQHGRLHATRTCGSVLAPVFLTQPTSKK